MSDDDQEETPATEQFDDEHDPASDEEQTEDTGGEHDETTGEHDDEATGGGAKPASAKFDDVSKYEGGGTDTDTGETTSDTSETTDSVEDDEASDGDASTPDDQSSDEELVDAVTSADNVSEAEADGVETRQKHVVTGGDFECELDLDRETTAAFLRDLAHQVETGHSLTVSGDDWEIPFEYAEPIEVEIEHEGDDDEDRELEIEIEFEWGGDGDNLEVR